MLTYQLKKAPGMPLYESLYRLLREDIRTGRLSPGERLPSKRALAAHLEVSVITVEAAYEELLSEGYIRSEEKVGYFVEEYRRPPAVPSPPAPAPAPSPAGKVEGFPFSVWSRLQREVVLDYGEKLLLPLPNRGVPELRQAIAAHLGSFRGMTVDPENILIGAGTDFLYNLLIQLLGRDSPYAVEDPGYGKIRSIYAAGGVTCLAAPMDEFGVRPDCLGNARVLHISPSHHYPTGLVTPPARRRELLGWAERREGWIIEDDYDSEFRFHAHPMSAMQTMDAQRVIYLNSFSKSLAPSIRISYMVLPPKLMNKFQRELGFYSCTVPSFEQYTLARFLSMGHFEKHINRMRKFYRSRRKKVVSKIKASPMAGRLTIQELDAGLHFLLRVDTSLPDSAFREAGIPFPTLGSFYARPKDDLHTLVVSYAGLKDETLDDALEKLKQLILAE